MIDPNPYASPQVPSLLPPPKGMRGVWRCDDLLITTRDTELPQRCLVTNDDASRAYEWTLGPALVGETIYAPLSESFVASYRLRLPLTLLAIVFGVALMVWASGQAGPMRNVNWPIWFWTGTAMTSAGMVAATYVIRTISLHSSNAEFICVRGVHPVYLASLPEWPYVHPWDVV